MRRCAFLLASFVVLAGCAGRRQPNVRAERAVPPEPDGNFVLYVSNQSFAITPVDITI